MPIVAEIPPPTGGGPPLRLTGQIDRLVRLDHEVLIIDYKTNRPPPRETAGIAPAYLYQLSAYRLAVKQVFGRVEVRAAILWTDGPRMMEIPSALLDAHQQQLWHLHSVRLDA